MIRIPSRAIMRLAVPRSDGPPRPLRTGELGGVPETLLHSTVSAAVRLAEAEAPASVIVGQRIAWLAAAALGLPGRIGPRRGLMEDDGSANGEW
jgi:hypothetical protein